MRRTIEANPNFILSLLYFERKNEGNHPRWYFICFKYYLLDTIKSLIERCDINKIYILFSWQLQL